MLTFPRLSNGVDCDYAGIDIFTLPFYTYFQSNSTHPHLSFCLSLLGAAAMIGISRVKRMKVMRVTQSLPYPLICGILSSVGFNLLKIGHGIISLACSSSSHHSSSSPNWPMLIGWDALSLSLGVLMICLPKRYLPLILLTSSLSLMLINAVIVPLPGLYLPPYPTQEIAQFNLPNLTDFKNVDYPSILMTSIMIYLRHALQPDLYARTVSPRPIHPNMLQRYQWLCVVQGLVGCPTVLENASIYDVQTSLGIRGRAPVVVACAYLAALWSKDFGPLEYAPATAMAAVLAMLGVQFLRRWTFHPDLGREKYLPILYVALNEWLGPLSGLGILGGLGVLTFVWRLGEVPIVKYVASGLTIRSTVHRSLREQEALESKGDLMQCLFLQGYVFFGNAKKVGKYVKAMFKPVNVPDEIAHLVPPTPSVLVLDCSLVTGVDVSAGVEIREAADKCEAEGCEVVMCCPEGKVRRVLERAMPAGVKFEDGLDAGLSRAEDVVLAEAGWGGERISDNGWKGVVEEVGALLRLEGLEGLAEGLEGEAKRLELAKDESLYDKARAMYGPMAGTSDTERGLFFVASGTVRIDKSKTGTVTRSGTLRRVMNNKSIGSMDPRAIDVGVRARRLKHGEEDADRSESFRLAKVSRGWVLGCRELATNLPFQGVYAAHTSPTVVYFVPASALAKLTPERSAVLWRLVSVVIGRGLDSSVMRVQGFVEVIGGTGAGKPADRALMARVRDNVSKMHIQ